MKLYEIVAEIENCVDYETGEIDVEKLEALEQEKADKVHNIGLWIKNLRAEANALKEEKMVFADRQKRAENKIKSLSNYLKNCLQGETFKDVDLTISYRKSQSVELAEGFDDERFTTFEPKVDKMAVKQALKDGEEIAGAMLIEEQNIQIK